MKKGIPNDVKLVASHLKSSEKGLLGIKTADSFIEKETSKSSITREF